MIRKVAFITGASSGLGSEFARQYAKKGYDLFLTARRKGRLENLAKNLSDLYSVNVVFFVCDLKNHKEVKSMCVHASNTYPTIDIVIANAGISYSIDVTSFSFASIRDLYDVNVFGVLKVFEHFIPIMIKQKRGHLVAVSSLAAFSSFPKSIPYCATKTALMAHLEGLYYELKVYGVFVTCLCPGFIKTAMIRKNDFPMPFVMEKDEAVSKMIGAIEKKKRRFVFPKTIYYFLKVIQSTPGLMSFLMKKFLLKSFEKEKIK